MERSPVTVTRHIKVLCYICLLGIEGICLVALQRSSADVEEDIRF